MYIKVKVKTNCKKEIIQKLKEDSFLISIKEKRENKKANKRICEIISSIYSVPLKSVLIIKGQRNSNKIILLLSKTPLAPLSGGNKS